MDTLIVNAAVLRQDAAIMEEAAKALLLLAPAEFDRLGIRYPLIDELEGAAQLLRDITPNDQRQVRP